MLRGPMPSPAAMAASSADQPAAGSSMTTPAAHGPERVPYPMPSQAIAPLRCRAMALHSDDPRPAWISISPLDLRARRDPRPAAARAVVDPVATAAVAVAVEVVGAADKRLLK